MANNFRGYFLPHPVDRKPIAAELRSVTCRTGSHSVTCHPIKVNVPRLNPSQPVLD